MEPAATMGQEGKGDSERHREHACCKTQPGRGVCNWFRAYTRRSPTRGENELLPPPHLSVPTHET
eukprot:663646-Rhodomonas_salina.1